MKITIPTLCCAVPATILTILTTGCATPALWKNTAAREWNPWSPDQLLLIETADQPPEVAVFFRQVNATANGPADRPVAWLPNQSPTSLIIGHKAITQFTNSLTAFRSIPLFTADTLPADVSSALPGYAVWSSANQNLTLHVDGQPGGPYPMPVTREKVRLAERLLVLPLAVAADGAIILGCLCAIGASGYH